MSELSSGSVSPSGSVLPGHSALSNEPVLPNSSSPDAVSTDEETMENQEINIPGVDEETVNSIYGGDMDIYFIVLKSFLDNTPIVTDKLRSVSKETLYDYAINVHGLKGVCASIGAEKVREKAFNLETAAKAGDLALVLAKNDELIKDVEILAADIKAWLKKHSKQ